MARIAVMLLIFCLPLTCSAQQSPPTAIGAFNADAMLANGSPAALATDALALLAQHQVAMGGTSISALQGTGTIMLPDSKVPQPVTVWISGSSLVKVKISNSERLAGFAAKGRLYKSYYSDGTSSIDAVGTGPASISAFQLLRTPDVISRLVSLSRDVATDPSGRLYDRLRARQALSLLSNGLPTSTKTAAAVDYYLDPKTHFVVRSATTVQVPGIVNRIPIETSYDDYRSVGTALIPFRISQTLNGQPGWTITLTSVDLNKTIAPSLTVF